MLLPRLLPGLQQAHLHVEAVASPLPSHQLLHVWQGLLR